MSPSLKALSAQIIGAAFALSLYYFRFIPIHTIWWLISCQAISAAAVALLLRSAIWWIPIHLVFFPAIVLSLRLEWHPGWYLLTFIFLLSIYWRTFQTQVPLYLTNASTSQAILACLPATHPIHLLDLGSGTGSLLRQLARQRLDCTFTGIEAAPALWWIGKIMGKNNANIFWLRGNFFSIPWHHYDVIYAFLSPAPIMEVWQKASKEMRPGCLLISNSFYIPGISPDSVIKVPDRRQTTLYLYYPAGKTKIKT